MRKFSRCFMTPVILLVALTLGACQSVALTTVEVPPAIAVIEALEVAHNAQDVDAIVALYADDGVQQNRAGTFTGLEAIRDFYSQAVKEVKVDNTHFQIEGNLVFYDCIMLVEDELIGAERYQAIVEDGKIKSNIYVGDLPVY